MFLLNMVTLHRITHAVVIIHCQFMSAESAGVYYYVINFSQKIMKYIS